MPSRHAVVLVSGGAAVTPFTTPDSAAATGLAAGNTMTAIRAHLLAAGHEVYTAPARIGVGEVREDTGWQGFSDAPQVLPVAMTINAVGGLDEAGVALDGFLEHLVADGVESFDLVGHSMGGLFSRAAIGRRRRRGAAVPVHRLVTLGTPWSGSLLGDFHAGQLSLADAHGDPSTTSILEQAEAFAVANSQGAADQVAERFLQGPDGWNARQAGALDGIAVTLVAGSYFRASIEPESLWPHDGLVGRQSALALPVAQSVLPPAERAEFEDVHSIFFANGFGLPWERALTWDPAVLDVVERALIRESDVPATADRAID